MFVDSYMIDTITRVNTFVSVANISATPILVKQDNYAVNGQSIMGLYSLDLSRPITVEFVTEEDKYLFWERYRDMLKVNIEGCANV